MLASCQQAWLVCAYVCVSMRVCLCVCISRGQRCRRWTRSFSGKTQTPNRRKPLERRPGETPSRTPHSFRSLRLKPDRGSLVAQRDQHFFVMGWVWRHGDDLTDSETIHMTKSTEISLLRYSRSSHSSSQDLGWASAGCPCCCSHFLLHDSHCIWGSLRSFVNL